MWPDGELELRQGEPECDSLRERRPEWMGNPALHVGHRHGVAAPVERQHVDDGRLLPQLGRGVCRHRQCHRRTRRFQHLLYYRAERSTVAERWWISGLWARRCDAVEIRPRVERGDTVLAFRQAEADERFLRREPR